MSTLRFIAYDQSNLYHLVERIEENEYVLARIVIIENGEETKETWCVRCIFSNDGCIQVNLCNTRNGMMDGRSRRMDRVFKGVVVNSLYLCKVAKHVFKAWVRINI